MKNFAISLCCPVCQSTEFLDFNGRKNARCAKCLSVERTRLLWMIIERLNLVRSGIRVLHFAPELPLVKKFSRMLGEFYHPCDLNPERYKSIYTHIYPIDICQDLKKIPSSIFDIVIHNHVLEHVCCSVEEAMVEIKRIMKPDGHHLFSVPFRNEITLENYSDELTDDDRTRLFGQDDHVRIFGKKDFPEMLERVWCTSNILPPLRDMFTEEELIRAIIPPEVLYTVSAHTIFHIRKNNDYSENQLL